MKRKVVLIRILSILLMAFMVFMTFSGTALAAGETPATTGTTGTTSSLDPTQFSGKGVSGGVTTPSQNIIGAIITIIQVIGTGVAVIILIWLAIKYITAAPNEKAEIKKSVTIYIVGAIVLFSASALLGIIKSFAESNVK